MGRMLCDHRLSAPPAQPNQRPSRTFINVGVLRSTSAVAIPRTRLSVQLRSGTWQVAQANLPLPDRRVSKNSRSPSSIASALPDTPLLASLLSGAGQGPRRRTARISLSVRRRSSAATPAGGGSAARAASAQPIATLALMRRYDVNPSSGEYE